MDFGELFGAKEVVSAQTIYLYLPNKTKNKAIIGDIESRVIQFIKLFGKINRGCTVYPNLPSSWMTDDESEDEKYLILENTYVISSFIMDANKFLKNKSRIEFLFYKFGVETEQQSLMLRFSGDDGSGQFVDKAWWIKEEDYTVSYEKMKKEIEARRKGL